MTANLNYLPLKADYDDAADILYLHVGEPAPAYSEGGPGGIILRYAAADERPCGVTVMAYRDWDACHGRLAQHVSDFLHIEAVTALRVIEAATNEQRMDP